MRKIQKDIDDWVTQYKIGYWTPHEMLARLTEEVGELAREINHQYGPKKKKGTEKQKEIGDEMADIIFTVGCFANALHIDLDKHFKRTMDKCYGRDKERFEKKG